MGMALISQGAGPNVHENPEDAMEDIRAATENRDIELVEQDEVSTAGVKQGRRF